MKRARKTSETALEVHAPTRPLTTGVTDIDSHMLIWCDKGQLVAFSVPGTGHHTSGLYFLNSLLRYGHFVEKLKARDTRKKNLSVDLGFPTGIIPTFHTLHSKRGLGRT